MGDDDSAPPVVPIIVSEHVPPDRAFIVVHDPDAPEGTDPFAGSAMVLFARSATPTSPNP